MYIADLHIHSRYSRATSKDGTPEYLDLWARKKGIDILGTGDFTHPAWREELREKLVPAEEGFYRLKEGLQVKDGGPAGERFPRFVVSGEISSIYKKNDRTRKVHNVILLPGLDEADQLAQKLEHIGNIHSDGRPILGLDSRDLLEITLDVCPRAIFVPAHIWTPHFSMFGAFSGFDTIEECFEDLTPYIRAFETGLSSDPPMNWRLSALDHLQMISNSDAHSPAKLGREANLLDIPMSYSGLYDAIQEGKGLAGTIEFFPEEGKYHYDGHRKCHLCLSPEEAKKYQGKCPVCGKKLTMGVSHRVEQLADRKEGYLPAGARPFESLVPLPEVIAVSTGHSSTSMAVQRQYEKMIRKLGTEFSILRELPIQEIQREAGYLIGEGIRRLREGKVQRFPGFDGEYGTVRLFAPWELESMDGQITMFGWGSMEFSEGAGEPGQKNTAAINPETGAAAARREAAAAMAAPNTASEEQNVEISRAKIPENVKVPEAGDALNEDQERAVRSVSPRIAVMAGPGTGKTKTLVSRILYLLQNRRVRPGQITAVTFTNQAAGEMRARLEQQLGGKRAVKKLRIGTFHSICCDQLKEAGREFILADEDMALELVKELREELEIKEGTGKLRQRISAWKTARPFEREESASRTEDDPLTPDWLEEAAKGYQEKLNAFNLLDFDDLLLEALELAEAGECAFPYLLVDEFQDISPLQYRLIQAWEKGGREVFIIGDPNQAIYGFRGADAESFAHFCQEKETELIRLRENYRSTPEILNLSQEVVRPLSQEIPLAAHCPSGFPVRLYEASGEMGEAIFIAKEINRLLGGIDMLDVQEGFACPDHRKPRSFGDIAVLYRTHRQAKLLETCLKKESIPYVVAGREEFLQENWVKGSISFFKSLVIPGDEGSKRLCQKLLWQGESDDYDRLAKDYIKLLCKHEKPQKIWQSWNRDMSLSDNPSMEKLLSMAVFHKTMEEMLTALSFGRESDLKRSGQKFHSDAVKLMTMHGAKGLEFPAVFLYGLREGMIPFAPKEGEVDLAEERRLFYVAITRAKEELIITSSGNASDFLQDLPKNLLMKTRGKGKGENEGGRQLSLFDFIHS